MNLITKKLRDVTKEELAEARDRVCRKAPKFNCRGCPFRYVTCSTEDEDCWVEHKDLFSDKFLDQIIEVEAPEILTKEEKEYLSAVIKPFRDRIISIAKITTNYNNREFILITYTETYTETSARDFRLPDFPKDTMYKNMSNGIAYKPEELGL